MINAMKQANEFGLSGAGQRLVSLLVFITDIHSLGLPVAQGLRFVTGFYWDRDDETRAWSKRFLIDISACPLRRRSVYSAIRHYLRAIEAAGTDEAKSVMPKMREIPVDDFYIKGGRLREDGRLLHDMYFVQVKTPAESSGPWDYYKIIATIPGDQAFRPAGEDGCP
jgi:branched-chain amino acid transport system substrate-binding protein